MATAHSLAWSGARSMRAVKSASLSRSRLIEANDALMQAERDYVARSTDTKERLEREAAELESQAAHLRSEALVIEKETEDRVKVLMAQARIEGDVAKHIKQVAERNALSILDRVKEASDSLMDWAGLVSGDMTDMLRKEASEEVERRVAEIQSIEEALGEEERAVELLQLASLYNPESSEPAA